MANHWRRICVGAVVLLSCIALPSILTTLGASAATTASHISHDATAPDWLNEINKYRLAAGLNAVTDQPAWDQGIQNHLTYLEYTPESYFTGSYQSLHTENPASPYYTPSGALEAGESDLQEGFPGAKSDKTPVQAIDVWLTAPFHAIHILLPNLTQVAFAINSAGYAGLDVSSGVVPSPPPGSPPSPTPTVLFPGSGLTTNLQAFGGELPNPLQTCGWNTSTIGEGLPIFALLPQAPSASLSATLVGPTGTDTSSTGNLCVVDSNTYVSSDPVYGPAGASVLSDTNAVVLIPATVLQEGAYTATINQTGLPSVTWAFNVDPPLGSPVVSMASLQNGDGYWLTNSAGGVSFHGNAEFYGSMVNQPLSQPVVGMAATPDGDGYWLVASDGGVFAFGDAVFHGSTGAIRLNRPIVGMAVTTAGGGYWLVASDGGVFAFGDAAFYGSMGAVQLNQPVVGIAATPDGNGYWLVAADGGVFAFGDAGFLGSMGGTHLNQPVVGLASAPSGSGYWLVASDGGLFAFGDAQFYGSMGGQALNTPIVGMATDVQTDGYWLVGSDGGIFAFNTPFFGAD